MFLFQVCEHILFYFGSVATDGLIVIKVYLLHSPQPTPSVLVRAGCSQPDDLSSNSVLNFSFLYFLIYTSFATVLTVEPTEYLEYKIKDGLVSF